MTSADEAGFAAVDALVALLILSSTLVLSLSGLQTAARLSRTAEETGEATALARGVLADTADLEGRSGGLVWAVETHPWSAGDGVAGLCERNLVIRSIQDGRLFRFSTAGACK